MILSEFIHAYIDIFRRRYAGLRLNSLSMFLSECSLDEGCSNIICVSKKQLVMVKNDSRQRSKRQSCSFIETRNDVRGLAKKLRFRVILKLDFADANSEWKCVNILSIFGGEELGNGRGRSGWWSRSSSGGVGESSFSLKISSA